MHKSLLVNRWLAWLILLPVALMVVLTAYQLDRVSRDVNASTLMVQGSDLQHKRNLNDFDEFYLIGKMYYDKSVLQAYDVDELLKAQLRLTGVKTFLPWTYPPQFTAFVALLPLVTIGWSFLAFTGGSLIFYLFAIRRFDWDLAGAGLLAVFPALILNARLGQNGFLTGGFIALVLASFRTGGSSGGVPLGLLAMKPHLGVGISLLALLKRRWSMIVVAAIVVVLTCALATLLLGLAAWPAWFAGVKQSSGFLNDGLYALYRLSSVYATLRSFGAAAGASFAVHVVVAIAAIAVLLFAYFRHWPTNRLLALAALVNVFISPYNHDYDYLGVAVAVMLIMPELIERARVPELMLFYLLSWLGTGSGLLQHLRAVLIYGTLEHPLGSSLNWSLHAPAALAAACLAALILRRRPTVSVAQNGRVSTQSGERLDP